MIKIPLTRQQFSAKAEQLKQEHGIDLETDSGIISKLGCTLDYEFDGSELTVAVKDKPFLISEKHVEAIVAGWLSSKPAASSTVVAAVAMILAAILCLCAPMARAQDVSNLYMGGVSYSAGASPAFAGTALYAHQVNSSGTYAFTLIDALPTTSSPFTVSTNIGIGIAQRVATIDGFPIFVPTAAGISYTGNNTGWAWSTGAGVPFKAKAGSNWYVMPSIRVLKSSVSGGSGYQPILGVLFGWGQ